MLQNPLLITNRNILIISIQPWYYELGSNCKNIALELSKNNRVLYVNIPITRKTYLSTSKSHGIEKHCTVIRSKSETIHKIQDNLWEFYPTSLIESINSLPFTSLFQIINSFNNQRFAKDIKKALKRMKFENFILFNDNDIYNGFYLKEYLQPDIYVYYMRDFLQGYPYWKKHSKVLEPKLIRKADIVVTNSLYYRDYCLQFNMCTTYIGQGCKLDLFNPKSINKIPAELMEIKKPVIGYVGALDSTRLDQTIIRTIAESNPEWQIVLVGPEDDTFKQSSLKTLANVHFWGRKPIETLPAYMLGFNVCMNPQFVNLITHGNYPLKIDEYLAMGKPVVATATAAMKLFQDYVYLAQNPEDYPALIQKALKEHTKSKADAGEQFAKSHTWENSISELYKALSAFEKKRK